MENLNAEAVKKALECCYTPTHVDCIECPYRNKGSLYVGCVNTLEKDALALITSQEQRIGKLEKRLRYLLQSKTIAEYDEVDIHTKEYVKDIHSLDANIKGLTEDNEYLKTQVTATEARYESRKESDLEEVLELRLKVEELTEENEKLSNAFNDLLKEAETYLKQREAFQSRVKYLEKENARLVEDNHILATEFKDKVKADTVQKFKSIIIENYAVSKVHYVENEEPTITYQLTNWQLDQIAKEMLEGEK